MGLLSSVISRGNFCSFWRASNRKELINPKETITSTFYGTVKLVVVFREDRMYINNKPTKFLYMRHNTENIQLQSREIVKDKFIIHKWPTWPLTRSNEINIKVVIMTWTKIINEAQMWEKNRKCTISEGTRDYCQNLGSALWKYDSLIT